ncbi:MAG: hypothetical protein K2Q25_03705 [Mycobacteriaceae bacterium]|nr:hypothetical protein [Mycobacteriaceae bacterium]
MTSTSDAIPPGRRPRPTLPPEGQADYLDEYLFEVQTYPLGDDVLVEDVRIPMRDGIALGATVYRPSCGTAVPAITTATPYGKDRFDQTNNFREAPAGSVPGGGGSYVGQLRFSDQTPFEAPDPGF